MATRNYIFIFISADLSSETNQRYRDVRSISKLEGHDTSRALFLKKKGALSKNQKGTSLFIAKSWGGACAPSAPWFLRLCSVTLKTSQRFDLFYQRFCDFLLHFCPNQVTIRCTLFFIAQVTRKREKKILKKLV